MERCFRQDTSHPVEQACVFRTGAIDPNTEGRSSQKLTAALLRAYSVPGRQKLSEGTPCMGDCFTSQGIT